VARAIRVATAARRCPEPFVNGAPNTYAHGLRIKTWRGIPTIGHDGLWPGFKTSFVRIPEHKAAIICVSNDATSDPHDLAFQVMDALIEGAPGVHPVPPMPEWATRAELSGCYLNRATGATVDIARVAQDRVTASVNGVTTFQLPTVDGRLATSRGSGDFTLRAEGETIELERDAGICETLHRITPGASLPTDLPGRYVNQDCAATWTITANNAGAQLRVAGPLLVASVPWEIEPAEGDAIRIYTPLTLYRGWLDTRVLRDASGRIAGLQVDGGRVKGLVFARVG
jgi:D-aminopeptidase